MAAITAGSLLGCGRTGSDGIRSESAQQPNPRGVAFGFTEDRGQPTYRQQAETGAPIRRFKVSWSDVEPVRGHWNWSMYDAHYRQMQDAGLRPLLLAIGGPCWTRPGPRCSPGPPDPSFDAEWSEYVRRLVERYPAAVGVEVWNEPNIVPMFPPRPDPLRFTALLTEAYEAVKDVRPKLPVILGGLLATSRSGAYGIADSRFLAGMLAAGAGDAMDAIGAHPYPRTRGYESGPLRYDLASMDGALDRLRAVRDAAGGGSIPIWITETGVSTASAPGFPSGATEPDQSRLLTAMVHAVRGEGDVQVMIIHRLADGPSVPSANPIAAVESGFGVFASSGRPKPAACALSRAFHGSLSCGAAP
jgi:hypothetical protein